MLVSVDQEKIFFGWLTNAKYMVRISCSDNLSAFRWKFQWWWTAVQAYKVNQAKESYHCCLVLSFSAPCFWCSICDTIGCFLFLYCLQFKWWPLQVQHPSSSTSTAQSDSTTHTLPSTACFRDRELQPAKILLYRLPRNQRQQQIKACRY